MTCSARLPVYLLLVSLLFDPAARVGPFSARGVVMFALYLMGAVSAMAAAAVFKRLTSRGGPLLPFYMEMPPYQVPRLRTMAAEVWTAAAAFLRKVSSIILVTTAVLWVLLNLPLRQPDQLSAAGVDTNDPAAVSAYVIDHSYAASIGRAVEPVFAPLGFDWRINVGILSSLAARETFVATLGQVAAAQSPTTWVPRCAACGSKAAANRAVAVRRADDRGAAAVLHVRAAVHVHGRGAAPRDRVVEVAGDRVRLHVRGGLGDGAGGQDDRRRAVVIALHAERVAGEPAAVRWVVPPGSLPPGRIRTAPGELGALFDDGTLTGGLVEHGAVWLWLRDGLSWRERGRAVEAALREALGEPADWVVEPAPGEVLMRVMADLIDGSVGDFVRSHGGTVTAAPAGDARWRCDSAAPARTAPRPNRPCGSGYWASCVSAAPAWSKWIPGRPAGRRAHTGVRLNTGWSAGSGSFGEVAVDRLAGLGPVRRQHRITLRHRDFGRGEAGGAHLGGQGDGRVRAHIAHPLGFAAVETRYRVPSTSTVITGSPADAHWTGRSG